MKPVLGLTLSCIVYANAAEAKHDAPAIVIEPRADELLRRMSSHLGGLPRVSFHIDTSRELVTADGLKIQFHTAGDVWLRRPDKLRVDWRRDATEASLFYDGRVITVHRKGASYFAQAPAPATLDETIDATRESLGGDAPAADLLFSGPYAILTQDVQAGAYLGLERVDDTLCHHLIFRSTDVDWQIWIEEGSRPLPRKLVITSKKMKGGPQYEARLSRWDPAPELADDLFRFTPPEGAVEVSFMGAKTNGEKGDDP